MVEQVEFPVLILWQAHTHVSDLLTTITPNQGNMHNHQLMNFVLNVALEPLSLPLNFMAWQGATYLQQANSREKIRDVFLAEFDRCKYQSLIRNGRSFFTWKVYGSCQREERLVWRNSWPMQEVSRITSIIFFPLLSPNFVVTLCDISSSKTLLIKKVTDNSYQRYELIT